MGKTNPEIKPGLDVGANANASNEVKAGGIKSEVAKQEQSKYEEDDSQPAKRSGAARAPNIDKNLAIAHEARKAAVVSKHRLGVEELEFRKQLRKEFGDFHKEVRTADLAAYLKNGGLQAYALGAAAFARSAGPSQSIDSLQDAFEATFAHPNALSPAIIESVVNQANNKRSRQDDQELDQSEKRLAMSGPDGKPTTSSGDGDEGSAN
ncbi:hypothetical protein QFC20_006525 [Naganishia adeliensis]|uniref:Uncharacterized protein n=1 Tax=Naganishia adeliensis TaxID=92952 RepID=A0ACC2VAB7_9TREE|nr:hypothetical protein QFC20_006525 [Naganishia adeliensis]